MAHYNPLKPPFLMGTLKIPLRKGGKGVVFCFYFESAELLPKSYDSQHNFQTTDFTCSTNLSKAGLSFTAISANIFRFKSTLALTNPRIKRLYEKPRSLTAALILEIHNSLNFLFRAFLSLNENTMARM